jgi:energy-coupling factor transporter ATP-binding protein EcfA2
VQESKESPTLADLLSVLVENKGSDLHLQSGEVPIGRINGELGRFEMPALTEGDVLRLAREALGSDEKMQEFQAAKDCDTAIAIPNLGRFRVNLFYQRNRPGLVLRTIGTKIPTIEQLELPEVLKTIAAANDGLVLVTGATGSGKSTTLAALIDHINATQACHIMTLEDPIEFVHENKLALINQREIAVDSSTFASALKHVLRQDPDVILIGEMRDLQTLLDVILQQLSAATFADWGLLLLRSQFSDRLDLRGEANLTLTSAQREAVSNGQGFLGLVLQNPQAQLVASFDEQEPFRSCVRLGFETASLLLSPIIVEGQLLGLIVLGGNEHDQFDLNALNLARGVARQAGQAILNARHREEEQARSRHSRQFVRF